jgi:hypothetical protein
MDRHELIAFVVLALVGLAIAFTALSRIEDGCRYVGGGRRTGGWDCTHSVAPSHGLPVPSRDWR